MKRFDWDDDKNARLKKERGVSFESVVLSIASGDLLDVVPNKNQDKYPGQRIFVVKMDDYVFLVPFEETSDCVMLKTIIPSRKATKTYLRGA